jgi:orotidine-5'-phosphate decarboxylase
MRREKCGLILALDTKETSDALSFLGRLEGAVQYVKIGPRLYAKGGTAFLREIMAMGYKLFLDLKLHDIPNTVASAVEPLAELGLWALTLHTSGGYEMMRRSVDVRDGSGSKMKLFGITVLTSLGGELWSETHPGCDMNEALKARARSAAGAGLDGIVCSPLDLRLLSGEAEGLLRVVPGIRVSRVSTEDQTRVATARSAAEGGADFIVVGRPILEAGDPAQAAEGILRELEAVKR